MTLTYKRRATWCRLPFRRCRFPVRTVSASVDIAAAARPVAEIRGGSRRSCWSWDGGGSDLDALRNASACNGGVQMSKPRGIASGRAWPGESQPEQSPPTRKKGALPGGIATNHLDTRAGSRDLHQHHGERSNAMQSTTMAGDIDHDFVTPIRQHHQYGGDGVDVVLKRGPTATRKTQQTPSRAVGEGSRPRDVLVTQHLELQSPAAPTRSS